MMSLKIFLEVHAIIYLILNRCVKATNPSAEKEFVQNIQQKNRTAVCLTGQLRSSNLTWTSGHLLQNANLKMFGPDDPPPPAQTIVEWLFRPIANHSGIDVFMYVTAHEDDTNVPWDGNPENYITKVGDNSICEVFSRNNIFTKDSGNKFF